MDNADSNNCIYCNSTGPFNEEHVFSAGLGGDDNNFLLKNLVCQHCNTEVFKRFENEAFRRSPIAIARQFLQNHGRKRSGKTTEPGIITKETTILDSESGEPLEARFRGKGSASILPQLLFFPESCCPSGEDPKDLATLYQRLRLILNENEVTTIKKVNNKLFELCRYSIGIDRLETKEQARTSKPTKMGIWLPEAFKKTPSIKQIARLYLDDKNINVRSSDQHNSDIPKILFRALKALPDLEEQCASLNTCTMTNPLISSSMAVDIYCIDRTLVKNAINLIAFLMGANYIRDAAFARAKEFVLSGKGNLPTNFTTEDSFLTKILSGVPADCHVIILSAAADNDGVRVAIGFRLYGSGFYKYQIAQGLPPPPNYLPALCLIHYNKNVVETFTLPEFMSKYLNDPRKLL